MNQQQEAWAGDFGTAYTARNQVYWRERIGFWDDVMSLTGARSVYEFGCNAGWNLSAIKRSRSDVQCYGHDLNEVAAQQARLAGHIVNCGDTPIWSQPVIDLVFTAGVLIHQAPDALEAMMQQIVNLSARWVLAVEYEAPELTPIEYRGRTELLWKGPYGQMYQDMGLRLHTAWDPDKVGGFDRCTAWLLEKRA